jgi:hypothetical protein
MHYSSFEKKQSCDKASVKKQMKILTVIVLFIAIVVIGNFISAPETREERAIRIERERTEFLRSIPREDILYDIDYLLNILEYNFPFIDSIYDRYGVDMVELGKELKATLENKTFNPDIIEFITLINDFLRNSRGIGHLRSIPRNWIIMDSMWFQETILTPQGSEFYGEIDEIDVHDAHRDIRRTSPIITTEIIEEDRIGYMKIHSFHMLQSIDHYTVQPFFDEIVDFEHLIIDLRGNGGGFTHTMLFFISPLVEPNTIVEFYLFFPQEEQAFAHIESMGLNREHLYLSFRPRHTEEVRLRRVPNEEVRLQRTQSGLGNEPDWVYEMLMESEYYITAGMSMFPTRSFTTLHTDFNGQLWLLTDGVSASMSEWVTAIMSMNDLAIVVGERTAGIFGIPGFGEGMIFPLPNTGMLIEYDFAYVYDRDGRPLSDGIDPDYWNRPGMDALETSLALINDGAYR